MMHSMLRKLVVLLVVFYLIPYSRVSASSSTERSMLSRQSATDESCSTVNNTPTFTFAYGDVTLSGSPAPVGSVVDARSIRGDVVGCTVVTVTGNYGLMAIYGEDSTITPPVAGIRPGEAVNFYVNNTLATSTPTLIWSDDKDLHAIAVSATVSPPTANFYGAPLSGAAPLSVSFTDTSSGAVSSWAWTFGDGQTSTQASPSHTYQNPGTYTVSLTVSGPSGSDPETKNAYITVYTSVNAAFSADKTSGTAPFAVTFSNQSSGDWSSLQWNFGDGTPLSNQTNPTHTYDTPGIYSVSLLASGLGGSDTETKTDYVAVSYAPPIPDFSAAQTSGAVPLTVNFTNTTQGIYTTSEWNFGDNTPTSNQASPPHVYSSIGTYTVILTVTGPGGTVSKTKTNYITTHIDPFAKISPANTAIGIAISPVLSWETSNGATNYEYCYDITNDNACSGTWVNAQTNTSVNLTGLSYNTTYYWQVRAINAGETAYANDDAWWNFTTAIAPPASFAKITPTNPATGIAINPTLSWQTSSSATSYEYCYDSTNDNACGANWISSGTNTTINLTGLNNTTTYYWQARAVNSGGITYANDDVWWSFTTTIAPNVWTGIGPGGERVYALAIDPATPTTLYAGTENGVFKSANGGENWGKVNTGLTNTSVFSLAIDPATPTTLYAATPGGVFKSTNSGENWSKINTGLTSPYTYTLAIDSMTPTTLYAGTSGGVFKSTNGGGTWSAVNTGMAATYVTTLAIDPVTSTTLYAGYKGTFKSTDGGGNWISVNPVTTNTIRSLVIDPVTPTTLYTGTNGGVFKSTNSGGNWSKVNTGLTNINVYALVINPVMPTTLYAGTLGGVFKSTNGGGSWSAFNTGLTVTYVRALAIHPTMPSTLYAGTDTNGVFTLIAPPGPFAKSSPAHTATGITIHPVLSWTSSSGAASYAYCYDTTNDATCSGNWTSTGTSTTATLTGLNYNTTYYWQARAINPAGATDANNGTEWSFTTNIAPPGLFAKSSPASSATSVTINPALSWGTSNGATGYEYCIDTSNNNTCDGTWISTGLNTTALLTGLSQATTYDWQVRATNAVGTTDANGGTWWSFTTIAPPGPFARLSPTDAANRVTINPVLQWETSSEAASYEYCYNTANDPNCNWISAGANTSVALSGLNNNTTYYWRVRAINAGGTTEANDGAWWSFTTVPATDVILNIHPAAQSVTLNQNFDVLIEVQAGAQSVDGAAAYLNFDPAYLQVVRIGAGSSFPTVLQNTFDNSVGRVNFAAGSALSGALPNGTFTLATVTFKAVALVSSTPIVFTSTAPYKSDVTSDGNSVLSAMVNGSVEITDTANIINGSVALQGRPARPDPRWSVPLNVNLALPGNPQPMYTFTPTTDNSGKFTVAAIAPGTYDVWVKHSHTLQNLKTLTLTAGVNTIDFGLLLEGDANNDNTIGLLDFSVLVTTFGKCQATSGYDPRADFNGDDCVTLLDFSLLKANYARSGASLAADPAKEQNPTRQIQSGVTLSVDPVTSPIRVGQTFTVTLRVQAGSAPLDGVQASLNFDPTKLQVKQITGNTGSLPQVLINAYDNARGTLDYAAGTFSNFPTGEMILLQIEFEAIAKTSATFLTFQHGPNRQSEVTFAGGSVLVGDNGGLIVVNDLHKIFQPLLVR
jgi:PKD repeat protein/photosystem II stability/assembly factor-like uncharacterized protein